MSDNRPNSRKSKIVPLFITFAVLFIVVFALGIIIGKGLGEPETPIIEKTYEIGVPDEEPDVEVVEEVLIEDTEKDEIESPAAKLKPEDLAKEKDDKQKDESIRAEDQVSGGTDHLVTRSPAPAPKPTEKTAKATEKPKAPSREDVIKEIKEDSLKKTPPKEKTPAAKTTMPKTDPGGQYTVQLAAFQNQAQANQLMNSMKSKGYPAFIKQFVTPDKKTWYRVRVGTFSTKEKAAEYGNKLKKQQPAEVKSVFITTNL